MDSYDLDLKYDQDCSRNDGEDMRPKAFLSLKSHKTPGMPEPGGDRVGWEGHLMEVNTE